MNTIKILLDGRLIASFCLDSYRISEDTVKNLFANITFCWNTCNSDDTVDVIIQKMCDSQLSSIEFIIDDVIKIQAFDLYVRENYAKKFITIGWKRSVWM